MLVLSRKENESIVLTLPNGQEIVVTVVEIDRGKIRLGFEAPLDIKIFRTEIWRGQDAIRREP
jgi:carbon storage regulator